MHLDPRKDTAQKHLNSQKHLNARSEVTGLGIFIEGDAYNAYYSFDVEDSMEEGGVPGAVQLTLPRFLGRPRSKGRVVVGVAGQHMDLARH